jgi:protein phosphatase
MVEDRELHEVVHASSNLADVPKRLIDLANDRGGDDNITVIVVQMSA